MPKQHDAASISASPSPRCRQPAPDHPGQPAPQVRKSLLQLIFSGAYLLRWNDKNRARDLLEIDKQAHKMLAACMLWDRASRGRSQKERIELAWLVIEGGIFDYFFRLVVTDIKPPIFYKIKDRPDQYSHLVQHVFSELKPVLAPMQDFWLRFQDWHLHEDRHAEARNLLKAAHLFASRWEFKLIEPLNVFDLEMPDINKKFQEDLDALRPLVAGLDSLLDSESPLGRFASFCGQLRFQVRWTQAPRIPQTDVLGHMFIVAVYAYLFSLSIGACRARCVNNFFTGLLHDLPELLTRDIISPVKKSSDALASLIKECEDRELEQRVFQPLEKGGEGPLVATLKYFLGIAVGSEFQECIRTPDGRIQKIEGFGELHGRHNRNGDDPKDGALVKACDSLAAFLEAFSSIRNGVSSPRLVVALSRLKDGLLSSRVPEQLNMGSILADFD